MVYMGAIQTLIWTLVSSSVLTINDGCSMISLFGVASISSTHCSATSNWRDAHTPDPATETLAYDYASWDTSTTSNYIG